MPTSSPRTNTRSSFSISSQMPWRIASTYVVRLIYLNRRRNHKKRKKHLCLLCFLWFRSPSSFFGIHISKAVFRLREWILLRGLNRLVNFLIDAMLQFFDARPLDQTAIGQGTFEAGDRIPLFPEFEQFRR